MNIYYGENEKEVTKKMHRIGVFPMIFIAAALLLISLNLGSASPIVVEVTAFEYKVYGKAVSTKTNACTAFREGFGHEPDWLFEQPDYLSIDCNRYRRALACYQDIRRPGEQYLSDADRTTIERACGL